MIHHVCQAAQMSMAVIKRGTECSFEEWFLIFAFDSTNNLIEGLPCYTAAETTQGMP